MKRGGRIRVSTSVVGAAARLVVADEGPGISRDVHARLFEPFFTTKGEGTGLGLSIVQRIVMAHGATIHCESRHGEGTVFTIDFPPAE
jgi:signal transduction histidine kinase